MSVATCWTVVAQFQYSATCTCWGWTTCWMPPTTCTWPSSDTSPHRSSPPNNGRSAGGVGEEACGLVAEVGLELFVPLIVWPEACRPSLRVLSRGEPGPRCSRRTYLVES